MIVSTILTVFNYFVSAFNPFGTSTQQATNGSTDPFGMSSFNPSQKSQDTLNNSLNTMDRDFLDLQVGTLNNSLNTTIQN